MLHRRLPVERHRGRGVARCVVVPEQRFVQLAAHQPHPLQRQGLAERAYISPRRRRISYLSR